MYRRGPGRQDGASEQQRMLRRFWATGLGYWRIGGERNAWALIGALLVLVLLNLGISYEMNIWNRAMFDALELRNSGNALFQAIIYLPLLAISVAVAVLTVYARMTLQRLWRAWFNRLLLNRADLVVLNHSLLLTQAVMAGERLPDLVSPFVVRPVRRKRSIISRSSRSTPLATASSHAPSCSSETPWRDRNASYWLSGSRSKKDRIDWTRGTSQGGRVRCRISRCFSRSRFRSSRIRAASSLTFSSKARSISTTLGW
jgi:hypothetical protein